MSRKGIILAGGKGTRLHPSTISVSKQLMPVYDKPMIYYPLATLMQTGIREIMIITTPHDAPAFEHLLSDGARWGLSLHYAQQPKPEGLAQALIIAEEFLNGSPCALILGDNLFFGTEIDSAAKVAMRQKSGASIFGYHVTNPQDYGVISFDPDGAPIDLVEKPNTPPSNYAVTGLYFYDGKASEYARTITPSARGELEITDLNRLYLNKGALEVHKLSSAATWLDTGTHRSLLAAAQFVSVVEERQGLRIGCPEAIAFAQGWINADQLEALAKPLLGSGYGGYLLKILSR